jgi:hypothetical protein
MDVCVVLKQSKGAAEAQKDLAKLYLAPRASRRVVRAATDEMRVFHMISSVAPSSSWDVQGISAQI